MADDQFSATLEWLLRVRREEMGIVRLLRAVRRLHRQAYSSQDASDIRRWASVEAQKVDEDMERLQELFDSTAGRYLEGPVVRHNGYLPRGTAGAVELNAPAQTKETKLPETRPIVGPGRRCGYIRKTS